MRASFSVQSSLPLSSSVTKSSWIGSSAPAKRLDDRCAPRAIAASLPSVSVKNVTTRSASPYATLRTSSAGVSIRRLVKRQLRRHVAAARLQHDRQREREEDEEEHQRDRDAEPAPLPFARAC